MAKALKVAGEDVVPQSMQILFNHYRYIGKNEHQRKTTILCNHGLTGTVTPIYGLAEDDGLPQYICAECLTQLKKAMAYRRRSRRAHYVLKEIHAIKKQVAQNDIEIVDRKKTNLISAYNYWDPKKAIGYSYTTLDAIENLPEEGLTPELEAALKESLKQGDTNQTQHIYNLDISAVGETVKIDIIPEETKNYSIPEEKDMKTESSEEEKDKKLIESKIFGSTFSQTNGEFIKHELDVLKTSTILVDIKPSNWKEIERDEEEKRKLERQREIELALQEIETEDQNDFTDDFVPEDIDLNDVFKGLKEESGKESDSDGEVVKEITEDLNSKRKKKEETKTQEKVKALAEILVDAKIRRLTHNEQMEQYTKRFNDKPFNKALFKCAMCLTVYPSMLHLQTHCEYHNSKNHLEFFCNVCKDRFETKDDLEHHSATEHWYEYTCPLCQKKHYRLKDLDCCVTEKKRRIGTNWFDEVVKHFKKISLKPQQMRRTMHSKRPPYKVKHRCPQCKFGFAYKKDLAIHAKRHDPKQQKQQGSSLLQCAICSQYYKRADSLARHMQYWHLYRFKCKLCNMKFNNGYEAEYHFNVHKQGMCAFCDKTFDGRWKYNHMMYAHRGLCGMCDFVPYSEVHLYSHQLATHGYIKPISEAKQSDPSKLPPSGYVCGQCELYFDNERDYCTHLAKQKHSEAVDDQSGCSCKALLNSTEEVRVHHYTCRKYPRKCEFCDAVLSYAGAMFTHRTSEHRGQAALCDECGLVVSTSKIRNHLQSHKKLARLRCRFCRVQSASESALVSHLLSTHTYKPYRCTVCSMRFQHRFSCRDHILKTHAPVLPYYCEACDRRFCHLDYLHSHCKNAHNVDLKKTDKSVYMSKRMFLKIYVYPHMQIDGTFIEKDILESVPVEICDYMDENNRPVDYREAFFVDPEADPNNPTLVNTKKKKKKRVLDESEKEKVRIKKKKLRKEKQRLRKRAMAGDDLQQLLEQCNQTEEDPINDNNEVLNATKHIKQEMMDEISLEENKESIKIIEDIVITPKKEENATPMEVLDCEELDITEECVQEKIEEDQDEEMEEVMGQLIEQDGEMYVLVDDMLYKLQDNK